MAGSGSGWHGFWDRGGFWRAALVAVGYIAVYLGIGWLIGRVFDGSISADDPLGDTTTVVLGLVVPTAIGSVVLLVFSWSIGFLPRPLFGRQPVRARWWMWGAPILVAAAAVFHFIGAPYGRYAPGVVVAMLFVGLFVGVSEELLTRGLGVSLLRRGGYREWSVMVLSSLLFALLHLTNAISGQPIATVLITVVYTFGFGISMYLTMRVGGNLVWPMLLHAMTDPSTALAAGGIDTSVATAVTAPLLIATIATFAYDAFAIVGLIATRGDAEGRADADEPRRSRRTPGVGPATVRTAD